MHSENPLWRPSSFKRFETFFESSTGVAKIVTDAGKAYIKPLGNAEGPHALAREWIGTSLARLFGLPTLEFAIMNVNEDDEIPLGHNKKAEFGPAFVTKESFGTPWSGSEEQLQCLENPDIIPHMVAFDTWILNGDRFPTKGSPRKPNYDNVFLAREDNQSKKFKLLVMDHTHCLKGETSLSKKIQNIDCVRDDKLYGMFPQFKKYLNLEKEIPRIEQKFQNLDFPYIEREIIQTIPKEWDVAKDVQPALYNFLKGRADFLSQNIKLMFSNVLNS